ncbi:MAG TPA: DUF2225 domain-containing protein [Bacilli bacterium]
MLEPLFKIKVTCLFCKNGFQSSRVRPSFKKAVKTDADFCTYYKEVNPDYYVVRVCPICGFASTESFEEKFADAQKKAFQEKVANNWQVKDYSGERSWDEALQTYKLALLCAQIKMEKDRNISGILHHIAWMYRIKGDVEQETRFLQFALNSYTKVYETEEGNINNARLMFLMGELNRRLKNYPAAVQWFSKVINDKKIMDSAMIRACREGWAEVRENMLEAKLELPEEMQKK